MIFVMESLWDYKIHDLNNEFHKPRSCFLSWNTLCDYKIHDLISRLHKSKSCLDSSATQLWAYSRISGFQPPLVIVFIEDKWAYTAFICPQPPFWRVARVLKSAYMPIWTFVRVAGLAKSCYIPKIVRIRGGWKLYKALYAQNIILHDHMDWMEHRKFGLSQWNGYIAILFKLRHPSGEFSGRENWYIREKIELHIHWMSDMRRSTTYKRVCELQKVRIYPKSQVRNLGEWCCNLKIKLYTQNSIFALITWGTASI